MTYIDFVIYKGLATIAVVFVVCFVYALLTGETIEQARQRGRRDKPPVRSDPSEH